MAAGVAVVAASLAVPGAVAADADAPAAVSKTAQRVKLSVRGGVARRVSVCGRTRRARVARQGTRLRARVRTRRRLRGRPVLRVERCSGTRWVRVSRRRIGRRGGRAFSRAVATRRPGDLRLRVRVGRRLSNPAYARVTEPVVEVPVSFSVRNVNRSKLSCSSDGAAHTVRGRLVAPRSALRGGGAVALYLHEYGFGGWFWKFPDRRYDYAQAMARAGHASVVVDRLGYDSSSAPEGRGTCLGSQADVAHQVVGQLRRGGYSASGGASPRFGKVALAGHSAGGAISEIAAYSFGGIDALLLFAYSDHSFSNRSIAEASEQGLFCATGGEPQDSDGPGGYAYFAQTREEFRSFVFADAEPAVAARAAAMRNRDPCGDATSLTPAVATNQMNAGGIQVPVLLLYGTSDAIYEQPAAGESQRDMLSGSRDVTLRFFRGTGHALTLERRAPEVRGTVSRWLKARGF